MASPPDWCHLRKRQTDTRTRGLLHGRPNRFLERFPARITMTTTPVNAARYSSCVTWCCKMFLTDSQFTDKKKHRLLQERAALPAAQQKHARMRTIRNKKRAIAPTPGYCLTSHLLCMFPGCQPRIEIDHGVACRDVLACVRTSEDPPAETNA